MSYRSVSTLVFLAAAAGSGAASAGSLPPSTLTGSAAMGDWHDDAPGVRRLLRREDMPAANVEAQPTNNPPQAVALPAGRKPLVLPGFDVALVTSGLTGPRATRVAPNGDLFVADSLANAVRVFRVEGDSAAVSATSVFADGLKQPFGMAFYPLGPNPEWLYVANADGVVRFPYRNGSLKATAAPQVIVAGLPHAHHWTRDLVVAPDGRTLYVSVGSGSNVALDMSPEPRLAFFPRPTPIKGLDEWIASQPLGAAWDTEERRAAVLAFAPEGGDGSLVATGLRNCAGLATQPATGKLWCAVNERDGLGPDTPFEYVTSVDPGKFYGWPWYFIGGNQDPRHAGERADLAAQVTLPDVFLQAHSAPLQIVFYEHDAMPEYKGSAFVTLHGSWNRDKRTGYKVVRVLFDAAGKPTGEYEDFLTGFVLSDRDVWGRPVGVAVAHDGSLFVTEDGPSGTIWRVSKAKRR
jgi:glucose/arabinose dehydrogenase